MTFERTLPLHEIGWTAPRRKRGPRRGPLSHSDYRQQSTVKVTREQLAAIREWHDVWGLWPKEIAQRMEALGWDVPAHLRALLYYHTRLNG